jgi:hypothetical protein
MYITGGFHAAATVLRRIITVHHLQGKLLGPQILVRKDKLLPLTVIEPQPSRKYAD